MPAGIVADQLALSSRCQRRAPGQSRRRRERNHDACRVPSAGVSRSTSGSGAATTSASNSAICVSFNSDLGPRPTREISPAPRRVVAMHPVAQGLPVHPIHLCRRGPPAAFQDHRQHQKPPYNPPTLLPTGQTTPICRRLFPMGDLKRPTHEELPRPPTSVGHRITPHQIRPPPKSQRLPQLV